MDVLEIILNVIEKDIGIDKEELRENLDMNLFSEGILDSLSLAVVLASIEERIGLKINIRDMQPADFASINALKAAIEKLLK